MKNILILNGSSRKKGYTSALIDAFSEGAKINGNEIRTHFLHSMNINKDVVLLMTARGNDYSMALDQYHVYTKYLGWNDLGTVLGRGKEDEARKLGKLIK